MSSQDRYLPIDEEGYFSFDGRRVEDEDLGRELIQNIQRTEKNAFITKTDGQEAYLEAFDEPLIVRHIEASKNGVVHASSTYHTTLNFHLETLSLDEWDRFHGQTPDGLPFVFSRPAQVEFFDLLDAFDDDSITIEGKRYPIPSWLQPSQDINASNFWTHIYQTETPGWDQGHESVVLPAVVPQLKLTKSRVLVLGAGGGHDAAYFARQGHVVTAVDFSEEAVQRMKRSYGNFENLRIVQADAFALPAQWAGQFDLVFEHTCYCAISPERRNDLVRVWRQMLSPRGHLLGVFFVMDKRMGPPFGGSEWEIRERLKSGFQFLLWNRWRHSIEGRKGKELIVYASRR